jgi:coenzyme PQQ synthesis protein D (PqqD)
MSRIFERNQAVEAAPLNEEAILLDPATSKFFMLNRTSSFIWDRLSKPSTAESLAGEICKSFENVEMSAALKDVKATLNEMQAAGLVIANGAD